MNEAIQHYNVYKQKQDSQEKELQVKIAKEFKLFDQWMKKLIKNNGTTKYQYEDR